MCEDRTLVEYELMAHPVQAIVAQYVLRQQVHGALDAAELLHQDSAGQPALLLPGDGPGESPCQRRLSDAVGVGQHDVASRDVGRKDVLQLGGVDVDHRLDVVDEALRAFRDAAQIQTYRCRPDGGVVLTHGG